MVSDVVCPSFAERGGRIGPSFGGRVSRRPNEGGQAKRGSPPPGRRASRRREITDPRLAPDGWHEAYRAGAGTW